jgi:hypothetical protein
LTLRLWLRWSCASFLSNVRYGLMFLNLLPFEQVAKYFTPKSIPTDFPFDSSFPIFRSTTIQT